MLRTIITNIQGQTSNRPLENSQAVGRSRTSRAANTFAALLIIEMLMNCIFNQINGAFHNYLSLYIGDNDNNTTFVESYCLFVALLVTLLLLRRSQINNMPSKSHAIALFPQTNSYKKVVFCDQRTCELGTNPRPLLCGEYTQSQASLSVSLSSVNNFSPFSMVSSRFP